MTHGETQVKNDRQNIHGETQVKNDMQMTVMHTDVEEGGGLHGEAGSWYESLCS